MNTSKTMINLGNDEALKILREHDAFEEYLRSFDREKYPGVSLEQAYVFISTGVFVEGMKLDSSLCLMADIKEWVSEHSHGGKRTGAGRKPSAKCLTNITLRAEKDDIAKAKGFANEAGLSLQKAFRIWLKKLSPEELLKLVS